MASRKDLFWAFDLGCPSTGVHFYENYRHLNKKIGNFCFTFKNKEHIRVKTFETCF